MQLCTYAHLVGAYAAVTQRPIRHGFYSEPAGARESSLQPARPLLASFGPTQARAIPLGTVVTGFQSAPEINSGQLLLTNHAKQYSICCNSGFRTVQARWLAGVARRLRVVQGRGFQSVLAIIFLLQHNRHASLQTTVLFGLRHSSINALLTSMHEKTCLKGAAAPPFACPCYSIYAGDAATQNSTERATQVRGRRCFWVERGTLHWTSLSSPDRVALVSLIPCLFAPV
jgi:hypothetical protein